MKFDCLQDTSIEDGRRQGIKRGKALREVKLAASEALEKTYDPTLRKYSPSLAVEA